MQDAVCVVQNSVGTLGKLPFPVLSLPTTLMFG